MGRWCVCRVSVLEAASGPAQGASGKSWAWLNANRKEPQEYKALSVQSMQEWRQLPELAEFPGAPVHPLLLRSLSLYISLSYSLTHSLTHLANP